MGFIPHISDLFGALADVRVVIHFAGASQAVAGEVERAAGLVTKEFRRSKRQDEILNRRN